MTVPVHPRACLAACRTAGLVSVLVAMLVGCGGGGGGGATVVAPPPATAALPGVRVSAASPVPAGCNGGRSSGTVFRNAEAEPMVAVSPLDSRNLVAVWQQDRASNGGALALVSAVSFDGGLTWARTLHPMSRCGGAPGGSAGDHERVSDPWVDFGPDGTVHLMGLAFDGDEFSAGSSTELLASRSTDGGRTWGPPASLLRDGSTVFNDKNTLTADPTDARYVYAVWDRIDASGSGPTWMARSSNGGLSWEPARPIYAPVAPGGSSQTIANRIVVLTDGPERGTLVNLFLQIDSGGTNRLRVIRSADKGLSWSEAVTIAEQHSVGARDPETGKAIRDGALVPSIATGPGSAVWVAWQDARFSGGLRDAIAVARSADGGRSWSPPVAVNRSPAVAAFTPTLQVRADGLIGLMHFDLRSNTSDANTLLGDLWLLTSRNGLDWSETPLARGFDIAEAPNVSGGYFLGDYHGLASAGTRWLPVAVLPTGDSANRTDVVALPVDLP
jgi:hypothetical protein